MRQESEVRKRQGSKSHRPPPQTQPDRKRPQLRHFRLLLIILFAATAVLLTPLAILKKRSEIEVILKVSQVSLAIGELSTAGLFNAVMTRSFPLQNVQQVELGAGVLEMTTTLDPPTHASDEWRPIGVSPSTLITFTNDCASLTLEDITLNQLS